MASRSQAKGALLAALLSLKKKCNSSSPSSFTSSGPPSLPPSFPPPLPCLLLTELPSLYLSCLGTTVQPNRTPVKPAY